MSLMVQRDRSAISSFPVKMFPKSNLSPLGEIRKRTNMSSSRLLSFMSYQVGVAQKEVGSTHTLVCAEQKIPMVLTEVEYCIETLFRDIWKLKADKDGAYFYMSSNRHNVKVAQNISKRLRHEIILSATLCLLYRGGPPDGVYANVESDYYRDLASAFQACPAYVSDYVRGDLSVSGPIYIDDLPLTRKDLDQVVSRALTDPDPGDNDE